jgi:hypothetical protein
MWSESKKHGANALSGHQHGEFVDLSQHKFSKVVHSASNLLFSINKIAPFPHYAGVRKLIRTKERKGNDMAKAATKAKTVAKKKAPAKKPAAKKRAGKRA